MTDSDTLRAPAKTRRRARRSRRWLILLVVLVLAGVGAAVYGRDLLLDPAPAAPRTVAVTRGSLERTVTSLGTIKPRDYVDVGAQISGQISRLYVEIGDQVAQGDLLAELDARVQESKVVADRAKLADLSAQLRQREAERQLARQQHQRNQRLFSAKAISEDELQIGAASLAVAEASIASLEAQIDQAQATLDADVTNLGYTEIRAPMAGTVVSLDAVEGQTLNANQTAPIILQIADLDTMTVWAEVAEADVVLLKPGTPLYFTTLGMPDREWYSIVRQVLPTPEVVNDVVLYNALIDIDNTDRALMSEMTAQVFFVLDRAEDMPLVPLTALSPGREGRGHSATVLKADGTQERRRVEVRLSNRTTAAIASGLEEGEQVVLPTAGGAAASGRGGGRPGGFGGARL